MNTNFLKGVMAVHGDTIGDLAKYLGITPTSASYKINEKIVNGNKIEFRQGEIRKIKDRYNLSPAQVDAIFF